MRLPLELQSHAELCARVTYLYVAISQLIHIAVAGAVCSLYTQRSRAREANARAGQTAVGARVYHVPRACTVL